MNSKMIKAEGVKKAKEWFQSLGVDVYKPIGGNSEVDLVAEFNGKAQRIRVKATEKTKDGMIRFDLDSSARHGRAIENRKRIDYYALYSIDRNKLYLIEADKAPKSDLTVRFEKNKRMTKAVREEETVLCQNVIRVESV